MENQGYVHGEQPPPYDAKGQPLGQPHMQPQPQMQPYPQTQPQAYGGYGYPAQPPAASQSSQSTVVIAAPQPQVMTPGVQVQDNMVISIISIFFCCILGIIATIKASDSKEALKRGDVGLAERQSVSARKLAIAAIVIGCVCAAISILSSILVPIATAASVSTTYDNNY